MLQIILSQLISLAFGAVTATGTGASNMAAPTGSTAVYYYSNITGTPVGGSYVVGDGTNCSKAVNANCRNVTDTFTLSIVSDKAGTGLFYVVVGSIADISTSPSLGGAVVNSAAPITANGAQVVNVTFGAICTKAAALTSPAVNSNCIQTGLTANTDVQTSAATITLTIVADLNGSGTYDTGDNSTTLTLRVMSSILQFEDPNPSAPAGVYQFSVYPGDEKVRIRDLLADTTFPSLTNDIGIQYLRFYYFTENSPTFVDTNFDNIDTSAESTLRKDFSVDRNTGQPESTSILGLQNNIYYYFKAALVDFAGNVGYVTQSNENIEAHAAKPDQVVGLLSENGGCFIATAAFGSEMSREVQLLRRFRDGVLLKSSLGKSFVDFYYSHSPHWAQWIAQNENLRQFARISLYPLVFFSFLALKLGAANACLLAAILMIFPILLYKTHRIRPQLPIRKRSR